MDINHYRKLSIEMRDDEIETMREIFRLAHQQLKSAPCIQLHGTPLERQAGLVGPQLFRVKSMLEQLGFVLGADFPYETPANEQPISYPLACQ